MASGIFHFVRPDKTVEPRREGHRFAITPTALYRDVRRAPKPLYPRFSSGLRSPGGGEPVSPSAMLGDLAGAYGGVRLAEEADHFVVALKRQASQAERRRDAG